MTDTFTWRVHTDSSGEGEMTLSRAKFGDGYEQTLPQGLNAEVQKWRVVYSGYGVEAQQVIDFIRSHKGVSFFWKPPLTATPQYFKCSKYGIGDQGGAYYVINLEFEQAFMP